MELGMDGQTGAVSAIMLVFNWTDVATREAELSVYLLSTITYGHELWLISKRMRRRIEANTMSSLCRATGLSLRE